MTITGNPSWSMERVYYRPSKDGRHILDNVTVDIRQGEFTAIIGPNGAGKSSLLNLLLGVQKADSGAILFQNEPIAAWPPTRLARVVGVVAQNETIAFPLRARDMVAMGRYPHLSAWQRETEADYDVITDAMQMCDVLQFADRDVNTLSGGEHQRVRIARALAQQPSILVLDEPTAALDVSHEMTTFELLRGLSQRGMTVVLVTHHINLAARYADRLVVLHHGSIAATGTPHEVLTSSLVEHVWQWPMRIDTHPGPGRDEGVTQVIPLSKPHASISPEANTLGDTLVHMQANTNTHTHVFAHLPAHARTNSSASTHTGLSLSRPDATVPSSSLTHV